MRLSRRSFEYRLQEFLLTSSLRSCDRCGNSLDTEAIFCSRCGAATPTAEVKTGPAPSRVGTFFASRYELTALVGEGGMAQVYSAYDRKHDRKVAVKMLRPDVAMALGSERFLREIGIAAKLSHPHILPLYDSGEEGGALFYVMPLVEGESLRGRIAREGRLSVEVAARLAREVGEALTYAHEQGFVHRDIKPDNIMLARGHALVADFGIARAMSNAGGGGLTGTGTSLGTPLYMSPEQCLGDPSVDFRTDIYSLGCVCFEMLTGRPPFLSDNLPAVLARHITEPPPLDDLPVECPEDVVLAIGVALAKTPSERFPSAHAFGLALEAPLATSSDGPRMPHPMMAGRRARWWERSITEHFRAWSAALRRAASWVWSTPRWAKLLATLAAVAGLVPFFGGRSLLPWWRHQLSREAPVSVLHTERWVWEPHIGRNSLVSIGDRSVGVRMGDQLLVFDGTVWTAFILPYPDAVLDAEGDSLFAYPGSEPGPVYRFTGQGWTRAGEVPVTVTTAWHGSGRAVVAGAGEMAERVDGRWRQLPTGRSTPILRLFGARRDSLTAIGYFAHDRVPDSLLVPAGSFWKTVDPRPSQGASWIYQYGAVLDDGSAVVVGYIEGGGGPLVMYGRSGGGGWTRAPVTVKDAQVERFDFAHPLEGKSILVWSFSPGLWIFDGRDLTTIDLFAGRGVTGVATVNGHAVVMNDVGTLFVRRNGEFEILSELPFEFQAWRGEATPGERSALAKAIGKGGEFPVIRMERAGGRLWALTKEGRIFSAACAAEKCEARTELADEQRAVYDLAASGDTVVAVGAAGLITRWARNDWRLVLGVPAEEFARVATVSDGKILVATTEHALLIPPGVRGVKVYAYPEFGLPVSVDADADSGVVLAWARRFVVVDWDGNAKGQANAWHFGLLTDVSWGCGGRLDLTSANLGDPLLGGEFHTIVRSAQGSNPRSYEPPSPLDLHSIERETDGRIRVNGRGGIAFTRTIACP